MQLLEVSQIPICREPRFLFWVLVQENERDESSICNYAILQLGKFDHLSTRPLPKHWKETQVLAVPLVFIDDHGYRSTHAHTYTWFPLFLTLTAPSVGRLVTMRRPSLLPHHHLFVRSSRSRSVEGLFTFSFPRFNRVFVPLRRRAPAQSMPFALTPLLGRSPSSRSRPSRDFFPRRHGGEGPGQRLLLS